MARNRYFKPGNVVRDLKCPICESVFVGDSRNVEKRFKIHMTYKHDDRRQSIEDYGMPTALFEEDSSTKKYIDVISANFPVRNPNCFNRI